MCVEEEGTHTCKLIFLFCIVIRNTQLAFKMSEYLLLRTGSGIHTSFPCTLKYSRCLLIIYLVFFFYFYFMKLNTLLVYLYLRPDIVYICIFLIENELLPKIKPK